MSQTEDESQSLTVDSWVAAIYNDNWYIGQILELDETDGEIHVNFLESSGKYGNNFKWPKNMDDLWITKKDIIHVLKNQPQKSGKSGRLFKLDDDDMAKIEEATHGH